MVKVSGNMGLRKKAFQRVEKMHPYKAVLNVTMFGSTIVFLFMLLALLNTPLEVPDSGNFRLPKTFVFASLLLLLSNGSMKYVLECFVTGNLKRAVKWMVVTIFQGLLFGLMQFLGWDELRKLGQPLVSVYSLGYVYVIFGLLLLHASGAMFYLIFQMVSCYRVSRDSVKKLVYETNPFQKLQFEILRSLWAFTSIIWLVYFLYFFISY